MYSEVIWIDTTSFFFFFDMSVVMRVRRNTKIFKNVSVVKQFVIW